MRKTGLLFLVIFLLMNFNPVLSFNTVALAADSHTLDINVGPVNEVSLNNSGNIITFNVDPATVAIDSSTILQYTTNESNKKITVSTPLNIAKGIIIEIEAVGVSYATGNTVMLSHTNVTGDIITSLSNASGSCGVEYEINVDENVSPDIEGNDYSYDMIYTIVDE